MPQRSHVAMRPAQTSRLLASATRSLLGKSARASSRAEAEGRWRHCVSGRAETLRARRLTVRDGQHSRRTVLFFCRASAGDHSVTIRRRVGNTVPPAADPARDSHCATPPPRAWPSPIAGSGASIVRTSPCALQRSPHQPGTAPFSDGRPGRDGSVYAVAARLRLGFSAGVSTMRSSQPTACA